jgi:hypothetical protein
MHDHILPQTQQRLPGERTPSRDTPANDEQRLIHPDHVSTKRTKHPTRHSLQAFRPKADMSSVFHPRHHGLPRTRRPLHRHARGLRQSTEREEFVSRAPRGKPALTRKEDSMRRRTAVSQIASRRYGVGPGCCGPAPTGRASIYRVLSSAAERDDERTSFRTRSCAASRRAMLEPTAPPRATGIGQHRSHPSQQ